MDICVITGQTAKCSCENNSKGNQWRNEVNCRPGRKWKILPPHTHEKKRKEITKADSKSRDVQRIFHRKMEYSVCTMSVNSYS